MSKQKINLTTKILLALVLGAITGILVFKLPNGVFKDTILINGIFELVGQLFLRGIMMLVVPLVFISLINGSAGMGDIKKLGRIGGKTVAFYLTTTAVSIAIALGLGYLIKPGAGLNLTVTKAVATTVATKTPLVQTLYEMVPKNPILAMAEGNMLQIIVFAVLTGIGLSLLGEKSKPLTSLLESLNDLIMKLVEIVMKFAPVGVFGLIAKTFATVGYAAMIPLMKYIITIYIGLILIAILGYATLLKSFTGLSLKKFYKKFFPVMSVGFSTASSNATVPVNLEVCEKELGVSKGIASFTIPLGATVNMNGTAIMQGVATFFVAQAYGIPVTISMMLTVVLTSTIASIGTAGVPGASVIMLSMVFASVGLPLEGIGIIMGIDRLVDMGRTVVNITGDAICTVIIAKQEGELDVDVFNDEKREITKTA
jgi:Na+/H+-dicarboxylate symporter